MQILDLTSPRKTSYRNSQIEWIVIHYTAGHTSARGAARANAKWYADPSNKTDASADYFVDDSEIIQYNPDIHERFSWAVGGKKKNTKGGKLYGVVTNHNSVSVEICSRNASGKLTYPNDPAYTLTNAAVKNAVELVKHLMQTLHIDANHVVRHYDVTGKLCPGVIGWNEDSGDESKWLAFKAAITEDETMIDVSRLTGEQCYEILLKANEYAGSLAVPEWGKAEYEQAKADGITDGFRPLATVTRMEAAIMARRAKHE